MIGIWTFIRATLFQRNEGLWLHWWIELSEFVPGVFRFWIVVFQGCFFCNSYPIKFLDKIIKNRRIKHNNGVIGVSECTDIDLPKRFISLPYAPTLGEILKRILSKHNINIQILVEQLCSHSQVVLLLVDQMFVVNDMESVSSKSQTISFCTSTNLVSICTAKAFLPGTFA